MARWRPCSSADKASLEQAWRLRSFLQNDLSLGLFVLTVTLAGIGFAMWAPRRDEQLYLLFALASLAYSVFSLNLVVRDVPVEGETWWWIANAAIDWWAVLLVLFGIRLMGDRMPRIETGPRRLRGHGNGRSGRSRSCRPSRSSAISSTWCH